MNHLKIHNYIPKPKKMKIPLNLNWFQNFFALDILVFTLCYKSNSVSLTHQSFFLDSFYRFFRQHSGGDEEEECTTCFRIKVFVEIRLLSFGRLQVVMISGAKSTNFVKTASFFYSMPSFYIFIIVGSSISFNLWNNLLRKLWK